MRACLRMKKIPAISTRVSLITWGVGVLDRGPKPVNRSCEKSEPYTFEKYERIVLYMYLSILNLRSFLWETIH